MYGNEDLPVKQRVGSGNRWRAVPIVTRELEVETENKKGKSVSEFGPGGCTSHYTLLFARCNWLAIARTVQARGASACLIGMRPVAPFRRLSRAG